MSIFIGLHDKGVTSVRGASLKSMDEVMCRIREGDVELVTISAGDWLPDGDTLATATAGSTTLTIANNAASSNLTGSMTQKVLVTLTSTAGLKRTLFISNEPIANTKQMYRDYV